MMSSRTTSLDGVSPDDCLQRGPLAGDSIRRVPIRNYDVFVNHRGPDLKKTLISHLFAALKKVNFTSFVDNEEIWVGDLAVETVKSAIEHSKIHISVFSPGYAESAWCLDELLFLMECFRKESTDLIFLPVFFNVTPSDLRLLTPSRESCYNSAFENHGRRYEAATISNWKEVLHEASMIKGYIFPDDFQGYEARLVESIVSKVIEVLSSTTLLHGPEHPVGLDENLREALKCMERGKLRSQVQKLGIYGMGGLGKTTLAKSIFNRIHREFESACFMQNVSERSKDTSKGLMGLQNDMLQELFKTYEIFVPNIARGKQMIRDRLEGKKVLIILDDVSEKEQLDQLMPPYDCHLGKGSQIVITTRDLEVLMLAQVETRLSMEGLHRNLACELFNFHAFHSMKEPSGDLKQPQEEPYEELKELAEKVADACQGLPLALEVLGSYLQGKDISEWQATVKVLEARNKMVNPQKKVTAILKISFDALCSAEETEMFLDIACFLFQEPKEKAMRIWRSDYDDAATELYLENLIRKCLVKLDKNGELTMHDLLRDMGREIVDNSHKDYWKRSHLWREEDVYRVLQKRKGTSHVRGLSSNVQKEWDTMSFTGMDELKLLVLSKVTLTGDFSKIPQELRWFQLRYCQLETPLSLNLHNVIVLDLEGSKLTSFNCVDYIFQNLKELNLSNCSNLKELPSEFGKSCNSLEILILRSCVNLENMPDSISELSLSLRYLDLSQCSKLTTLPNGITNLRALSTLLMNHCGGFTEFPDSIGQLTALEKIGLDGVPLSTLPQSFDSLSSLVSLRLDHSSKLRELPSTIGRLTKLTSLDIISCPLISEIPPGVTKLTNLVQFCVSDCKSVSQLPKSIGNLWRLVELHVHDIVKLICLPSSISKLHTLKVLYLQGCANLSRVENLPLSLTSLDVGGCTSLKTLDMRRCSELKTLPDGLECFCHLSYLDITKCRSLVDLPSGQLVKFTSLKRLHLTGSGVTVVQDNRSPWIQNMVSLEEVTMEGDKVPDYFNEEDYLEYQEDSWKVVVAEGGIACMGVLCCVVVLAKMDVSTLGITEAEVNKQGSVRAEVVGKGYERQKFSQALWCQHKSDSVWQLQICIFRASHPLVTILKGGDTIHVRAHSQQVALKVGVVKLMYGESEMEETLRRLALFNKRSRMLETLAEFQSKSEHDSKRKRRKLILKF